MSNTPTPMDKQPYHQEAERLAKDQVFVPEKFRPMDKQTAEEYLEKYIKGDIKRDYDKSSLDWHTVSLNNALKAIRDSQKDARRRSEEVAVKFAEWINRLDIYQVNAGYWVKNNPAFRDKNFAENTSELFSMYQQHLNETENGKP